MKEDSDNLCYQIAFSRVKGMNILLARQWMETTGNLESFFTLPDKEIKEITGWNGKIISGENRKEALRIAKNELAFLEKKHVSALFFTQDNYPARLLDCTDAPLLLYYFGNGNINAKKILSIVGTRHATAYGKGFCEELIKDLSYCYPDLLIISGLAYGIDICAHRAALKNNLQTVGVLAHGLNQVYPSTHRHTAIEMLHQGGLITEYPSTQSINKGNFVARNRIVAGMCDAVVVIESGEKGGALITAGIAESYHRDVFALPGRTGDTWSQGCNRLIHQNKAALITSARDLIESMRWSLPAKETIQPSLFQELNDEENLILNVLRQQGEAQINQLTVMLEMTASQVLSNLIELEFKNLIRTFPGGVYRPV